MGVSGALWSPLVFVGLVGGSGGSVCNVNTPMENFSSFYMKESTP